MGMMIRTFSSRKECDKETGVCHPDGFPETWGDEICPSNEVFGAMIMDASRTGDWTKVDHAVQRGPWHPCFVAKFLLERCAREGDLQGVRSAFRCCPDISIELSKKAFEDAAGEGYIEIVEFLLDQGLDPNSGIASSVHTTANTYNGPRAVNTIPILELLLQHGWNCKEGAWKALDTQDTKAVEWLLEHGADPNKLRLSQVPGITPQTPLAAAISHQPIENVKLLLAHGADPNLGNAFISLSSRECDHYEWTELGTMLLEHNADINATVNQYHPDPETRKYFAEHPFRAFGTALQKCAEEANCERVRFLLNHGADPCREDSQGNTPLGALVHLINRLEDARVENAHFRTAEQASEADERLAQLIRCADILRDHKRIAVPP